MPVHAYEVRPRRDHRSVNLISDALPFGRLWYAEPNAIENAIDYANHRSPAVYDDAGNVIETHKLSSNSPLNALGRWGLPRRLVSPKPCAKAEASTKVANPRFFEKSSFF